MKENVKSKQRLTIPSNVNSKSVHDYLEYVHKLEKAGIDTKPEYKLPSPNTIPSDSGLRKLASQALPKR